MRVNDPAVLISLRHGYDEPSYVSDEQWQDVWRQYIETLPPAPELSVIQHLNGSEIQLIQYSQQMNAATWAELKKQAIQASLTPGQVLLAAYVEVLTLWSKSSDFTINLTEQAFIGTDTNTELKGAVNQLNQRQSFSTLLAVNSLQLATFEDRAKHIVEQLKREPKHQTEIPLHQLNVLPEAALEKLRSILGISFVMEPEEIDNFPHRGHDRGNDTSTVPISLTCRYLEQNGALTVNLYAAKDLFPPDMVRDMLTSCCEFLQRLADAETAWQENIRPVLPAAQLEQRVTINATTAPLPDETLYSLFVERAKQQPQQVAIVTTKQSITYDTLYCRANQIGYYLKQLHTRPNSLIAIVMEKGWEQIVAVLGIYAAGSAYVPIDPELPPERFQYLLENSGVDIVLTQSWLDDKLSWPLSIHRLAVDQTQVYEGNDPPLSPVQTPEDLAYVIYTSGSTGLPKGVMITHRNVVNVVIHTNQRFQVNSEDRVLALTALNHDLSVYDIFGPLSAGGTIVMPDAAAAKFARHWVDLLVKEQITLWNSVPAMMEMLISYLDIKGEKLPSSLRLAILGGDWLPVSLVSRLKATSPNLDVLSIGGPTETTIWNIGYLIQSVDPDWKSIPYGKPMANSQYYVLNDNLEDCPIWVPGQMYCAGAQVARGYWRNVEKTAANFIYHPRTGERIYRTGDLGRYLPDGNIEFLGRVDFQIKLRGYRIEAGEIEAVLTEYPAVENAVVTVMETPQCQKYLKAYVVSQRGHILNVEKLCNFLDQKLPSYMVPSDIQILDVFPLTANGKVDRRALAEGKINR
ncbi:MAG: amino acid adenylation domain-containing protein [Cyanothece sp. SIO2G6]|nr:amino acid adenylation domain-containing protein [Cyanothece sp. SIO2G6]